MRLNRLSLRLRIFLFFALLALGGLVITAGGLVAGYRRAGDPALLDAYVFSGLVIGFLVLALVTAVWFLFDEHVAKPIERIASEMRSRAHAGVAQPLDAQAARYLGDLAPAAEAVTGQLSSATLDTASAVAEATARLEAEKAQLAALLTEIPVAMVMVSPAHQIMLYDGQAAAVLAQIAPPRLNAALGDYLNADELLKIHDKMARSGFESCGQVSAVNGAQRYDLRLRPLGHAPGYMLIFDQAETTLPPEAERPLIYDFELASAPQDSRFEDMPLRDLSFVVFDTETTGLLPHKDEIVQIGALRVLRGRIVPGEEIDTLVHPGRPIPPASTKVHGVSDAMVEGAPDIATAGALFHGFCRDAVIVAHNAPFDMAFLRRHARDMGVSWDHPILDTVLLSAVLFGASVTHTLDALCDRLGVTIPEALRHTALGDARATAEVLCAMLPMLEARGLASFGAVIEETKRHGRLLEDLN